MPRSNNGGELISAIKVLMIRVADKIAKSARSHASWSKTISHGIKVDKFTSIKDEMNIAVFVNLDEVPQAAAFEFGSGLSGKAGKRYLIEPKEPGGILVFPWATSLNIGEPGFSASIAPQIVPGDDAKSDYGIAHLPKVMHPGVRPKPYLKPALDENKEQFVVDLADLSVKHLAEMLGPRIQVIRS